MERLSRVKKYENLRKSIETDRLSGADAAIKDITDSHVEINTYAPSHEKEAVFNEEVKKNDLDNTFKNEYLDSFIQEVRDYNIKKGVREYEDTKLDILQQLSSKNREKRANYVENIEDNEEVKEVSDETMEISRQVLNLLNENSDDAKTNMGTVNAEEYIERYPKTDYEEHQNIPTDAERMSSELESRIASLESQLVETTQQLKAQNNNDPQEDDFEQYSKRELVEETMKLKVQMDEYKDELEDLNTGIDSNNRLLNIIITILIIALLSVIGVVVYWLISGGIL